MNPQNLLNLKKVKEIKDKLEEVEGPGL